MYLLYGAWGAYAGQHGEQLEVCGDSSIRSKATREAKSLVADTLWICRSSHDTALFVHTLQVHFT